ncbi:Pleckstriny domain-containing family A member 8 [Zalerion maritima]|uniref:Pleckstriny domain-containing family A member 8 n=1 Tax=Zalerion maritima TaxID=339359 RepID=A0AAD5RW62_9PEZI|nr:Pleckstriny domain-containing family A member 8 [Zalerion maritima]
MSGTLLDSIPVKWSDVPIYKVSGGNKAKVGVADVLADVTPQVASDKQAWATSRLVSTEEFLKACEGLTLVFDALQSAALDKIVKADILNNVAKLRTRFEKTPAASPTIQELCLNEIKEKEFTATEGFVWLVRTLNFTLKALKRSVDDEAEELSASFKGAYQDSLAKIHNFVMRGVAMGAWGLVPYRAEFYKKLGEDQSKVKADLTAYLADLEKFVQILRAFIESEPTIMPKKFKTF